MPFQIRRAARGLSDVLRLAGGDTPGEFSQQAFGMLDLAQFYGANTHQNLTGGNGAAAQAVAVPTNSVAQWSMLLWAQATCTKAAAMTDLQLALRIARAGTPATIVAEKEAARVGIAGGLFAVAFIAPYPILLPPFSTIEAFLTQLTGVANAVVGVQAEVAVFE